MNASRGAGIPVTFIRELRVLQQCRHANLVTLKRVVTGSKSDRCSSCMDVFNTKHRSQAQSVCSIFLVFEYLEHDLGRLLMHRRSQHQAHFRNSVCVQHLPGV